MKDKLDFYINGQWTKPSTSETIEVFNPATEEVIGLISAGTKEDVNVAVGHAKEAFKTFSKTSPAERADYLKAIIEIYEKRMDEVATTVTEEMGAPLWLSQVAQATTGLSHFKRTLKTLENYEFERNSENYIERKEAIGVVGMITPWNWPMNQMCTKVASAIAAGCTMVLKPSEISPYCAILLAEIIDEAGLPKGVFNLVNGYGPIAGAALSENPDVDMISITGSTRAGIAVAQASAPSVKRVAQELGGKSANIVLDDANIEKAIASGISQCFLNTGQTCTAPTRMLVSAKNYDKALEIAKAVVEKTTVGDPMDENSKMGPISNKAQYEKVIRMIEIGIEEGATLVAGGTELPDGLDRGYYVKPTIFADVTNDMTIAREEVFGPVLCILKYETEEEAIEIANDTDYGLAGYVQGEINHAQEVARHIRAGQITINGGNRENNAPFGGYKASGNGREHGTHGLEDYLETKAMISPLG
jgi:aldehyde dehydrogenase (NAD+)